MANETPVTVVGFLTADPELKSTQSGLSVVNITIASTPSKYDKNTSTFVDGETLFMKATAWRNFAENISQTLHKGSKVIASGKLVSESYTDKDGNKRTSVRMDLESLGADLSFVPKSSYSEVRSSAPMENWMEVTDDSPF